MARSTTILFKGYRVVYQLASKTNISYNNYILKVPSVTISHITAKTLLTNDFVGHSQSIPKYLRTISVLRHPAIHTQ